MASIKRWQAAQQYERGYWQMRAREIADGASSQLDWYRWQAEQLVAKLRHLGLERVTCEAAHVIEIGSGPVGVATFMPGRERVLVDPLEEFYRANEVLRQMRRPDAVYRQGMGESLPAEDTHFDLAIIQNCIDHVRDMDAVMQEVLRVLRPDGVLYLTVNCRSRPGFAVHRVLSRLRLDPGHPHTFTPIKLRGFLQRYRLHVLSLEAGSYRKAREEDLQSQDAKDRLKARLGISEFLTSTVSIREGATSSDQPARRHP